LNAAADSATAVFPLVAWRVSRWYQNDVVRRRAERNDFWVGGKQAKHRGWGAIRSTAPPGKKREKIAFVNVSEQCRSMPACGTVKGRGDKCGTRRKEKLKEAMKLCGPEAGKDLHGLRVARKSPKSKMKG